ncbi:MAG TPA: FliG C-terminal domain-containing protein [Planctomycetota bacterium]|nr:FliG C-terminal domain-containing protein [Planctomycetota bacterium]
MSDSDQKGGAAQAAAFLLTLDKDAAAAVLRHLDPTVIVEVVEAMGDVDASSLAPDSVRELYKRVVLDLKRPGGVRRRSAAELKQMIEQTLGREQAGAVFETIQKRLQQERPFLALEKEPSHAISTVLTEQSDAVVALVLAHLDPSLSADVLSAFPPERSTELVRRMATLIPPGIDTLLAIADDLLPLVKQAASATIPVDRSVRLRSVAEMLGRTKGDTEKTVLESLDEQNSNMVKEIREFMFTWDDLASLERRSMQKILAAVDTRTLAVGLKGSSKRVEENIVNNLSERVRAMIADERELAGALPMAEVQKSRDEIMNAVRTLMEAGEVKPSRAGEELVS